MLLNLFPLIDFQSPEMIIFDQFVQFHVLFRRGFVGLCSITAGSLLACFLLGFFFIS